MYNKDTIRMIRPVATSKPSENQVKSLNFDPEKALNTPKLEYNCTHRQLKPKNNQSPSKPLPNPHKMKLFIFIIYFLDYKIQF